MRGTHAAAASADELRALLMLAGVRLARDGDPERFLAWFAANGPSIAPSIAGRVDPAAGTVSHAFRAMVRMLYNVTPLPRNAWAPSPLLRNGES